MSATTSKPTWVFGYGSLIWRPDFDYIESAPASVSGWKRRFWQGSHDHRGVPDAPGRVVTMIQSQHDRCAGMAYLIEPEVVATTFEALDHREKNGYERFDIRLEFADGREEPGVVYIAPEQNFAWLGPAPLEDIASQIATSRGPSGANSDYLLQLDEALKELDYFDAHVVELAERVRKLIS